jgi:putative SbcD/Mre11-related phosphoesterase
MVQPVPDEPAATVTAADERLLVVADYHAGLEDALRREGVELRSGATDRRERLLALVERESPDRLVVLGDLANAIGRPGERERRELDELFAALGEHCAVTVAKGNHDGDLDEVVADLGYNDVAVSGGEGIRIGDVSFAHGHTWPSRAVLAADTVCVAHEHPQVRLADEVGGAQTERAWLRGRLNPGPFRKRDSEARADGALVVFPAFNDRVGGTWINETDDFLSPFLPAGLRDGEAYLLDGTRLGRYDRV